MGRALRGTVRGADIGPGLSHLVRRIAQTDRYPRRVSATERTDDRNPGGSNVSPRADHAAHAAGVGGDSERHCPGGG